MGQLSPMTKLPVIFRGMHNDSISGEIHSSHKCRSHNYPFVKVDFLRPTKSPTLIRGRAKFGEFGFLGIFSYSGSLSEEDVSFSPSRKRDTVTRLS